MVHMLPKSKHSHIDVLWSIIDMEKNHCVGKQRQTATEEREGERERVKGRDRVR